MHKLHLKFVLESDATFGCGEGVAGLVDAEVEHDDLGFPYLRGRALKGLLVEEVANLLYALKIQNNPKYTEWENAADTLFGKSGTITDETGILRVGDARLPKPLRDMVRYESYQSKGSYKFAISRIDILESLTGIRRQTAMDETGRANDGSLRSMRVILRETPFESTLQLTREATETELALLSAAILAFQRAGTGRNRGRGALKALLLDETHTDITPKSFAKFQKAVS